MTDRDTPVTALLPFIRHGATCALQAVRDNAPDDEACICGLRETWAALASSDDVAGSGEPYQDDIIQAATGGPDFTVKEWPSDDVAERHGCIVHGRALDEMDAQGKCPECATAPTVEWGFIDPETGEFMAVTDAGMRRRWATPTTQAPREETP